MAAEIGSGDQPRPAGADRLLYGVAGYPVAHSRSPEMHLAAYRELGIDADYQRLPIPPELFDETVRSLPAQGFGGINVTIPHKEAAAALADRRSPAVEAVKSANTLTFIAGEIHADNTDAPGLIAALPVDPAGTDALVLGAGGTARAVIWALRSAGARVHIWNRSPERATRLAGELGGDAVVDPARAAVGTTLIVNTTALGMDAKSTSKDVLAALRLDLAVIDSQTVIVDFVYRDGGSPLTLAARELGLRVVSGDELLVSQGAISFERWFGRDAPLLAMRAAISGGRRRSY